MKISKNRKKLIDNFDISKLYEPLEAIKILKEKSFVKFDETLDVSINLNIDTNKSDQNLKGVVNLPKGTGKKINVAVIASEDKLDEAKNNGADTFGGKEMIETISSNKFDFDVLIASPDMMPSLGKVAKILGPKGLMPNPKLGTVTKDVAEAIKKVRSGQIEYKTDKTGIVHASVGKISFSLEELKKNILFFYNELIKNKPTNSKGVFIKKIFISSTMGPGLQVDLSSVM